MTSELITFIHLRCHSSWQLELITASQLSEIEMKQAYGAFHVL